MKTISATMLIMESFQWALWRFFSFKIFYLFSLEATVISELGLKYFHIKVEFSPFQIIFSADKFPCLSNIKSKISWHCSFKQESPGGKSLDTVPLGKYSLGANLVTLYLWAWIPWGQISWHCTFKHEFTGGKSRDAAPLSKNSLEANLVTLYL